MQFIPLNVIVPSICIQLYSILKGSNPVVPTFETLSFELIAVAEAKTALSCYHSLNNISPTKPIWALAENYRFEPAFVEVITLAPSLPLY